METARLFRRSLVAAMIALCLFTGALSATPTEKTAEGVWNGAIEIPGMKLDYTLKITTTDSGLVGSVDIPAQGAVGLPTVDLRATDDSLTFGLQGVPGSPTFLGLFSADRDTVSGSFTQGGATFPFSMSRVSAEETQQQAESLQATIEEIRRIVDSARTMLHVPGVAIGIVKGGEVVLSEGFGWRNREDSLPVTTQTLFPIGSSSKAFTTMAIGMLVDDGKMAWDEKVRTYLPWFALEDEFASDRVTVRDLCTHRTGLPRHDLAWYGTDLPRDTLIYRVRYLEPNKGFRTDFQYQNFMFLTAGELAARVNGSSWEELIQGRILDPLGMSRTNFSVSRLALDSDRAIGYGESHDTLTVLPYRNIDDMAPAGAINSSVDDMVRWVKLFLDDGKVGKTRLISEGQLAEMYTAQIPIGHPGPQTERLLTSYGLGWFIEAYRGHYRVQHGGNIDGFSALVSYLPYDGIGIVVLTNKNATPLPSVVSLSATDRLLGLDPIDWLGKASEQIQAVDSTLEKSKADEESDRVPDTKPSHKLEDYAGKFENPGYGTMRITYKNNELRCLFHSFDWAMKHWHYDVFKASDENDEQSILLEFHTNARGDIDEVSAPLEATVDPIVFTRVASEALSDPKYLKTFEGKFTLMKTEITVALVEDRLQLTVPGQPTYTLVPYKRNEFNLKGQPGFSVEFRLGPDGSPTAAVFHQPNGNFAAERVTE